MDLVLTIHSRLENLKSPGYKPCELHDDNESISRNFFRKKILVLIWDVVNGKMFKKFFCEIGSFDFYFDKIRYIAW